MVAPQAIYTEASADILGISGANACGNCIHMQEQSIVCKSGDAHFR